MNCIIFLAPPPNFTPRIEVASSYCMWNGQLLLLKRQSHKSQGNTWGVPAGKLEINEKPVEALQRELIEEIGVEVEQTQLHFFKTLYIRQGSLDFIYHMFYISFAQPITVSLNLEEHQEYQWTLLEKAFEMPLMLGEHETLSLFKSFLENLKKQEQIGDNSQI